MQCWNIRQLIKGLIKKGNITGQLVDDFIFFLKKNILKNYLPMSLIISLRGICLVATLTQEKNLQN